MYNTGGTATLIDDTFTGNSASEGAGVYNATGTVALTNDTFTDNTATRGGGAVYNSGTATASDSRFVHSTCSGTLTGPGDTATPASTGCPTTAVTTNCPPKTTSCQSASSRPGRTATVSTSDASVTVSGRGTVSVGAYRTDPVGALGSATASYFEVSVSSDNAFSAFVVHVPSLPPGAALEWWNGTRWLPVVGEPGTTAPGSVTLGATSSPSLATAARLSRLTRFGGVVFGVTKAG